MHHFNTAHLSKMAATKGSGDGKFDILSLLINSNNLSEAELTGHLLTLLISVYTVGSILLVSSCKLTRAGLHCRYETTSVAFVWMRYRLVIHQDGQTRLRTGVWNAIAGAEP